MGFETDKLLTMAFLGLTVCLPRSLTQAELKWAFHWEILVTKAYVPRNMEGFKPLCRKFCCHFFFCCHASILLV
jgi:hypothetical protein